jgi:hypothetical protein
MGTCSPLQRLGLSPDQVQAMIRRHSVPAAPPVALTPYKSRHLINTQYLDGEQQRMVKAALHANEAVIIGMIMQGIPFYEIALVFGVTEMAIRNRGKAFGVQRPLGSVWNSRTPIYRHIAKHEVLCVEIDDYQPKRKASSRKFDPRQLLLAGIN